ncbi:MAG: (Fe-S)-binding protein [Pirellulales bacterium]
MDLRERYDELVRCNRCGFCQTACPVFRATGHEAGVARGRIALLRALVEERIDWDEELVDPLFACLLCGSCTSNCFPAVETADLILEARSEYLERVGRGPLHRLLFDHLLPFPKRLRRAARVAALGKKTGLSKLARALGLLRVFGRDFSRSEDMITRFPDKALREKLPPGLFQGTGTRRIGYFVGCGTDVVCPAAGEASLGLLRGLGSTVTVLDNCCCGLPPMSYGDRAASTRLAEKNLELIGDGVFDLVVTDCSSCAAFLKKYPSLLGAEHPRHEAAVAFAASVRDLTEVLERVESPRSDEPTGPNELLVNPGGKTIVTYHDPCHAARGQGLVQEPREALRSIAGLEYRELPEADWCCGGAGSYALSHYDISRTVLDRKMDHLERTGANLLVTSCPACIIQLSYGVRKRHLPVRVCHISEVLANRNES